MSTKKVWFRYPKVGLGPNTGKAILIKLGGPTIYIKNVVEDKYKCWLPLSQVTVQDDLQNDSYVNITLPLWLFDSKKLSDWVVANNVEDNTVVSKPEPKTITPKMRLETRKPRRTLAEFEAEMKAKEGENIWTF
jgi:hypothetical protein